jgi:A/G-specific adenine glycosylase
MRADGAVLVRTRAPKGLLGGMTEVPTTDWTHDFAEETVLAEAPMPRAKLTWRRLPGVITHVFTHFPLELAVYTANVATRTPAPAGTRWVARAELAGEALPNLMRKVLVHALG